MTEENKIFHNIAVLLPAFNEAKTIGRILKELKCHFPKILVVDDGSSDSTAFIATQLGIEVLRQKHLGKGAAMRNGLEILKSYDQHKAALIMDADGQHTIEDAIRMAEAWNKSASGVIAGERQFRYPDMPLPQLCVNIALSQLFSPLIGRKVTDQQCGLRLYPMALIPHILPESNGYIADMEMLLNAHEQNADIYTVSIKTIYDAKRLPRPLHNVLQLLHIAGFIAKSYFKKIRKNLYFFTLLIIFGALFTILIIKDIKNAAQNYQKPRLRNNSYVAALEYLRKHSPENAIILSPWEDGNQIVALAERRVVASSKVYPSETAELAARFRDIGKFFFAKSDDEAQEIIKKYGVSFVFLGKQNFDFYLCRYARRCGKKDSLIYQLLSDQPISFLTTAYENKYYKILEVNGATPQRAGFNYSYANFLTGLWSEIPPIENNSKPMHGGILPHHYPFTDALFPEFFTRIKAHPPDVILLLGPDHKNIGKTPITISAQPWETPFGILEPYTDLINRLTEEKLASIDEKTQQAEWSVQTILPYIAATSPQSKIVPIIIRSDISKDDTERLARELALSLPPHSLIILSADFSHKLTDEETERRDKKSRDVIEHFRLEEIPELSLDNRQGLLIFLSIMREWNAEKLEFLGYDRSDALHQKDPFVFPDYPYIVSYFSYAFYK